MKQNNHNTHFYSIQEVERCLKSTEEFEDGEQLFYYIGALRYVYDENKKKDKEIERLNNIINEMEKYLEENKYFYGGYQGEDREDDLSIIHALNNLKELKESGNNE